MEVKKIWFDELPDSLDGDSVVIDAYAGSTNIPLILARNPKRLIAVNEENLTQASQTYPSSILIGESDRPNLAFVAANHPDSISGLSLKDRDVLWMSINGSRVLERVQGITSNGLVLTGAFNNSRALLDYLQRKNKDFNIVMAGSRGIRVEEDRLCGDYLESRLYGKPLEWADVVLGVADAILRSDPENARINIAYVLNLDRYHIVPRCFKNPDGFLEIASV